MRRFRPAFAAALLLPLLAACATTIAGVPVNLSSPATTSSPSHASDVGTLPTGRVRLDDFQRMLKLTSSSISSNRLALDEVIDGVHITVRGGETSDDGHVYTLAAVETAGTRTYRYVYSDGRTYVRMPTDLVRSPRRPWVDLTHNAAPGSDLARQTSEAVRGTGGSLLFLSDANEVGLLARTVVNEGPGIIDKTPVTHFHLVIDFSKSAFTSQERRSFRREGLDHVPFDMYLDADHRARRIDQFVPTSDGGFTKRLTLSQYNVPVVIDVPDPNQIER